VHPTGLGSAKIVANVNMDMYLPLWPLKSLTALGADQSSLGAVVETAVKAAGLTLMPDPEPNRNLFIRSDQYNFIRKGVPALALKF
ncbi:M28 family peptidase, partial [Klebsiella pneumoniae]|uniref:M28 family peptidase n=1 Tax=Klebsiella pneumoniae TaxID=573 RepID=UPI0038518C33